MRPTSCWVCLRAHGSMSSLKLAVVCWDLAMQPVWRYTAGVGRLLAASLDAAKPLQGADVLLEPLLQLLCCTGSDHALATVVW